MYQAKEEKMSKIKTLINKEIKKKKLQEQGITLIALVITIILLLILAGVTLNAAIGENGLFERAKLAREKYEEAETDESRKLENLESEIDKQLRESITTVTNTEHETDTFEDSLGNPVVIPGGFKYKEGTKVEEGIVIEDDEGNQFVWIPVSNTDGDNDASNNPDDENLIKLKSGEKVEITLGRYTFAIDTSGTPKLVQKGANHSVISDDIKISSIFYEDTIDNNRANGRKGAKDLAKFVQSVKENHGYYLARYEASYKSGTSADDYKLFTKQSESSNTDAWSSTPGRLWNWITQSDASTIARNMYSEDDSEATYVESDLVNSYAWDTAIVYIQAMGNDNYANQGRGDNTSLMNTGATEDVKCNIYDMAGNVAEWTTEYSTYTNNSVSNPCAGRGGSYNGSGYCTADRGIGFRPLLYLK